MEQDGAAFLKPRDYFNWVGAMMYQRRLKMNPLWLYTVMGGFHKESGEAFLGTTDMYGLKIEHNYILTGLALHYCQVMMEQGWKPDMSEMEVKQLMAQCCAVLFYNDKKAADTIQFSVITKEGVKMDEPVQINSEWNHKFYSTKNNEFWRPMRCQNY